MEELLNISVEQTQQGTQSQRGKNLEQRIDKHADHTELSAARKGLCDAEGNRAES